MVHTSTWTERELVRFMQQNGAGAIVVTSTARAARAWRSRYDRVQKENSLTGWTSPQVLAWEPWLRSQWNAAVLCGAETRAVLSQTQELHLWRSVLEQDETARQTLSYAGLAKLAQQAYGEMARHCIALQQLRGDGGTDTQAFYRWTTAWLARMRKLDCLPAAQLEAALADTIASGKLGAPKDLVLLGFDRITPSQHKVMDALRSRHCNIHAVELRRTTPGKSQPAIVCANTLDEEIACAAQWIRGELLSRPDQRIGVLVSSSKEIRDRIDSTFRAILAPSTMDIRAAKSALPYEFSLGTALPRLQPIRTALTWIRWLHAPVPAQDVSWLLVHGGFSSGSPDARAVLDGRFRERAFQLGDTVSLAEFFQWFSRHRESGGGHEELAGLHRAVQALFQTVRGKTLERPRMFGEWSELLRGLLKTAELHLLQPATSEEHQLLQRWDTLLDDFSSLSAVAGAVGFSSVMAQLERMANDTLFALETSDAPVQVLGIPESAGLIFDAVWWLDAQASVWPPRGQAQPFLPWTMQRAAHMPYADPAEDAVFAQRVTRRVLDSGTNVIVSFALQSSDPNGSTRVADKEVVISPLVRQALPETPILAVEEFIPPAIRVPADDRKYLLETVHEERPIPLHAATVGGGVGFLELQSACPFRAFAEVRMASRPLKEGGTGLDAADQGTLVHRVLQRFWQEVGSQKKLLQAAPTELRHTLRRHIQSALTEYTAHASEPWQTALLEIEAERMEERLALWLEREKNRPEFEVIKTEDVQQKTLGGVGFHCRVDRMDTTRHGQVLLDYKTGPVSARDCSGERPDQPQLPAYAVPGEEQPATSIPLAGIAFAGLHPRKIDFTVIASRPAVFGEPTEKPSKRGRYDTDALSEEEFQKQLATWKTTLSRLAENFRDGLAVVDPKNGRDTCTYCAQALICRIGEADVLAPARQDDESFDGRSA